MSKPRVAIFDFACCEGCQLQIVNLEEEILDLIHVVDVVEWREAMSEQSHDYDIAIVERVPRGTWNLGGIRVDHHLRLNTTW